MTVQRTNTASRIDDRKPGGTAGPASASDAVSRRPCRTGEGVHGGSGTFPNSGSRTVRPVVYDPGRCERPTEDHSSRTVGVFGTGGVGCDFLTCGPANCGAGWHHRVRGAHCSVLVRGERHGGNGRLALSTLGFAVFCVSTAAFAWTNVPSLETGCDVRRWVQGSTVRYNPVGLRLLAVIVSSLSTCTIAMGFTSGGAGWLLAAMGLSLASFLIPILLRWIRNGYLELSDDGIRHAAGHSTSWCRGWTSETPLWWWSRTRWFWSGSTSWRR